MSTAAVIVSCFLASGQPCVSPDDYVNAMLVVAPNAISEQLRGADARGFVYRYNHTGPPTDYKANVVLAYFGDTDALLAFFNEGCLTYRTRVPLRWYHRLRRGRAT